jgi:hypothetical protein
MSTRRFAPLAIALMASFAYPVAVLSRGGPHFPDRGECVHRATGKGQVVAVFGRFRERGTAVAARRAARLRGFTGLELERDGCGVVEVVLNEVPSLTVGRSLAAEAHKVGLRVSLERPVP